MINTHLARNLQLGVSTDDTHAAILRKDCNGGAAAGVIHAVKQWAKPVRGYLLLLPNSLGMSHGYAYFSGTTFMGLKNCREYVNVQSIDKCYLATEITNVHNRSLILVWIRYTCTETCVDPMSVQPEECSVYI